MNLSSDVLKAPRSWVCKNNSGGNVWKVEGYPIGVKTIPRSKFTELNQQVIERFNTFPLDPELLRSNHILAPLGFRHMSRKPRFLIGQNICWTEIFIPLGGMNLQDYVYEETVTGVIQRSPLDQQFVANLSSQLLRAVRFLHYHSIAHLDLSLSNVVFDSSIDNFAIIDFERAQVTNDQQLKDLDMSFLNQILDEIKKLS